MTQLSIVEDALHFSGGSVSHVPVRRPHRARWTKVRPVPASSTRHGTKRTRRRPWRAMSGSASSKSTLSVTRETKEPSGDRGAGTKASEREPRMGSAETVRGL
jgi:hypothetical protein